MLVCLTMIISFFSFPYISSDFCFMLSCFFVVRCLMVFDVYLFCELYLLSLKIFIFVSFKDKFKKKKTWKLEWISKYKCILKYVINNSLICPSWRLKYIQLNNFGKYCLTPMKRLDIRYIWYASVLV